MSRNCCRHENTPDKKKLADPVKWIRLRLWRRLCGWLRALPSFARAEVVVLVGVPRAAAAGDVVVRLAVLAGGAVVAHDLRG